MIGVDALCELANACIVCIDMGAEGFKTRLGDVIKELDALLGRIEVYAHVGVDLAGDLCP